MRTHARAFQSCAFPMSRLLPETARSAHTRASKATLGEPAASLIDHQTQPNWAATTSPPCSSETTNTQDMGHGREKVCPAEGGGRTKATKWIQTQYGDQCQGQTHSLYALSTTVAVGKSK